MLDFARMWNIKQNYDLTMDIFKHYEMWVRKKA